MATSHLCGRPEIARNLLPLSLTLFNLSLQVILVGGAEIYRNRETDLEKRCYPGGPFDPLGFADGRSAVRPCLHGVLSSCSFDAVYVEGCLTGSILLEGRCDSI